MIIAVSAALAGLVHVLTGPDHLAAVAPYAVDGKTRSWRTGVRWGLGHSAGVLAVGVLALMLRGALDLEPISAWSERLVGVVLIAIGAWGLRKAWVAARQPMGSGPSKGAPSVHGRAAFGVGTLHGLAGSSHVLGVAPALLLSDGAAATYLLFFGVGSVVGMGAFSGIVGALAAVRPASLTVPPGALLGLCSMLALGVGGFWLVSSFAGATAHSLAG